MNEKPWWFPVKVDEQYFARLHEDYPENEDWTDEELNDYYNEYGRDYSVLWDHLGDAYEEYKPLADSFLELLEALEYAVDNPEFNSEVFDKKAREAIAKAKGES